MKKLVIAGGTGFLGTVLANYFSPKVSEVVILGRDNKQDFNNVHYARWHTNGIAPWWREIDGADAVINLAGKNVNCRYTATNKNKIYASRLDTTTRIGEAIKKCSTPPQVWINASSATIYRDSKAKLMTESDGELGHTFSEDVCRKWEEAFHNAKATGIRTAVLRTSIVLGNGGGALIPLTRLVRAGLGGYQGDGMQQCSWIHEYDFCRAVEWILNNVSAEGVYNITAPNPVPNRKFMNALRAALHVPFGIPIGKPLLEVGAFFIRTETEMLLKSRNVYPERLARAGFTFKYPTIDDAFYNLKKNLHNGTHHTQHRY